jgi:hypothetical protein
MAKLMDDLKLLATELLEKETKFLLKEKEEYGAAVVVVVTPEERYWKEVEFDDEDEKIEAYRAIVSMAKEDNATAIITLNSSFERPLASNEELHEYQWGDLEKSGAQRAIIVTISGPSVDSWSLSLPYRFENGAVLLGDSGGFQPAVVDLLPDWP